MILRVLTNTGATLQAHGMMCKEVEHTVLLYGCKIWVVTGDMFKVLEGFHHRVYRYITGMEAKRVADS